MAVADLTKTTLQLVLNDGNDLETGKTIYKSKSFNNVKTEATSDQLFTIAKAIAALQQRPLYEIKRRDESDIRGE
ncbi:DUF1659 domain-containing protein [Oceanobacillus chungangensis]|uniref:DUF1659 domain-containing protein n=1 Tax=Oceanobacillus chungangensis TaxID=1229152 RepID=A0A3D8PJ91_9BACI|nr:DUF1659 domain-containing protein [Oceanobacillus chungangensis]RDW15547.1 hypothetical protein CWR45_17375 [Oceanobacillus chungangensis]